MKFRYVLVALGGLVIAGVLITATSVATYQPNHYKFLGTKPPKKTTLEPDPVGLIGREARYYVLPNDVASVANEAQQELALIGWTKLNQSPQCSVAESTNASMFVALTNITIRDCSPEFQQTNSRITPSSRSSIRACRQR